MCKYSQRMCPPRISRQTDKGKPRDMDTGESDTFLLSGSKGLVPEMRSCRVRYEDTASVPGYTIHRYQPRIEAVFAGIKRWTHRATGEVHWRSIDRENLTTLNRRAFHRRPQDSVNKESTTSPGPS